MTETPFDPTAHLRRLRLQGQPVDYLDVKWRLVWLRTDHPEARIATEHIQITPESAVFRATVTIPDRGSATGHGSATSAEHAKYVEAAETAALGRALLALGFGTAYAADHLLAAEEISAADGLSSAPSPAASPAEPAPVAPAAPQQPAGLPPGVAVGPGGNRGLPPKLAAIFAQARPIVDDEPEPEMADASPAVAEPAAASPAEDLAEAAASPIAATVAPEAPPAPPARLTAIRERGPAPEASPARPPSVPAAGSAGARPSPRASQATPAAMPAVQRAEPAARGLPPSLAGRDAARPGERPERSRPAPEVLGRGVPQGAARPAAHGDTADAPDDDGAQADNDWSAFWPWARGRGYFNRDDVEKAIGQSIKGRTPRELRTLILNLDE